MNLYYNVKPKLFWLFILLIDFIKIWYINFWPFTNLHIITYLFIFFLFSYFLRNYSQLLLLQRISLSLIETSSKSSSPSVFTFFLFKELHKLQAFLLSQSQSLLQSSSFVSPPKTSQIYCLIWPKSLGRQGRRIQMGIGTLIFLDNVSTVVASHWNIDLSL